jgi:hypothetical protein
MASERQIAANRRNARSSTGPRSQAGKKRVSRNAFRHGLTMPNADPDVAVKIDELTLQLAGEFQNDRVSMELARTAAQAEFDRKRARRTRLALIERATMFGSLVPPKFFRTPAQEGKWLIKMEPWISGQRLHRRPRMPKLIDPSTTMPAQAPDRIAEGTRRILRELMKLERYEARALSRRDRAIRAMISRTKDLAYRLPPCSMIS